MPKVKVTITSELYNIDLITNYINYLKNRGINYLKRQYQQGQFDENKYQQAMAFKKTWNQEVLWGNVKLFFKNFYNLYGELVKIHFPSIQEYLRIVPGESTTTLCLLITDETKGGPYLEIYYLRPDKATTSNLYFFVDSDQDNPINRKSYFLDNKYDCTIESKTYEITNMHVQTLDFMFEISPTYALINDKLSKELKQFFNVRKQTKNNPN